jgi:surfactin synthase thioesterase subunit
MGDWQAVTSAGFELHEVDGGHLFLLQPCGLPGILESVLERAYDDEQTPAL